jgi:endonuclease YncB( thermonuclease family)
MTNYPFLGTFRAQVVRVHDGDTATLYVDCGFRFFKQDQFRLFGINAPELHATDPSVKAKAAEARDRLSHLLGLPAGGEGSASPGGPWPIRLMVQVAPEKYGRWLATLFITDGSGVEVNVNNTLVKEGLAVPFMVTP